MAKATNFTVDPNNKRLTDITDAEKKEINQYNKQYDSMIDRVQANTDKQVAAYENYGKEQTEIQQKQGQLTIDKLEMERQNAKQDYLKEQSGAYVDWQKQSGQYGANAEKQAAVGLAGSGYAESSQVAMYTAYQNRVATAREAFVRADKDFAIGIEDARLKNSAALAEIAFNTLKASLEAGLNGLMMENQLLSEKISTKQATQSLYWDKYSTTLNQINRENSMAEQVRQFNEQMAEDKRQYNESLKVQKANLQLEKDKFAWQKSQASKSGSGGGGGGGGKTAKEGAKAAGKDSSSIRSSKNSKIGNDIGSIVGSTTSAVMYLNELIKSGASKDKVANEIAIALREEEITKEQAAALRNAFTPRGVQY